MKTNPKAFSLIELLIAIAIIASLMALGFSGLNRLREGRLNAQCVGRLRGASAAVHLLVAENSGVFRSWARGDNLPNVRIWGDTVVLRKYTAKETLRCPAGADLYPVDHTGWYRNTYGFNMIDANGAPLQPKGGGQEYELRFAAVAEPAKHILLADSATLAFIRPGVRSETFRVNINKSTDGVQLRHFGRMNVAFMDGHIESLNREEASDYFPASVIYERNQ